MGRKIDVDSAPVRHGTGYPPPYDTPCLARRGIRLSDAAGLTQISVNRMHLPPGSWSSQRHWHAAEDEFVYVLEGEVVLITEAGEETFRAGDCAGFKAGVPDGHHFQNRSRSDAVLLQVGRRDDGHLCDYPDIDLVLPEGESAYHHKDGRPY